MRVLSLGGTGNLGSQILPALLVHGHDVFAYVRSPEKLQSMMSTDLLERITIIKGDAMDSQAIASALIEHQCDAIVNAAGNQEWPWREQTLAKIVASVTAAAIKAGEERGRPLRAWVIGGMGSLQYPGTTHQIQSYLPAWASEHHRGTEEVMKGISLEKLQWSVLCVALMFKESPGKVELWSKPRPKDLLVSAKEPPGWQNHWIQNLPIIGTYINIVPVVNSYTTKYEDVADIIADDLESGSSAYIGEFVGYKSTTY